VPDEKRGAGFEANIKEWLSSEKGMRGAGNGNEIGRDSEFIEIRCEPATLVTPKPET